MLLIVKSMRELDFPSLMEVYVEANEENGADRWPDEPPARQVALSEEMFREYLTESFFKTNGARYMVWTEKGNYVSALRLEPYNDGLLLEALETAPDERKKGYAFHLISSALATLHPEKPIKVYSHVSNRNVPSLRIHEKCGFHILYDYAHFIDGSVNRNSVTMTIEIV